MLIFFSGKIKSSAWECSHYSANSAHVLNYLKNNKDRRNDISASSLTAKAVSLIFAQYLAD